MRKYRHLLREQHAGHRQDRGIPEPAVSKLFHEPLRVTPVPHSLSNVLGGVVGMLEHVRADPFHDPWDPEEDCEPFDWAQPSATVDPHHDVRREKFSVYPNPFKQAAGSGRLNHTCLCSCETKQLFGSMGPLRSRYGD